MRYTTWNILMEQIGVLSRRIRGSPQIKPTAEEYFRLAQLKYKSLSQYALAAICVELTCHQLGEPVDKKLCQSFSGLHVRQYMNEYRTVEKILKLQPKTTLSDLVIRFGVPELESPAHEVLTSYREHLKTKHNPTQYDAIDFTSSLYTSVALYVTSKLLKVKCDKTKLQSIASTNKVMFNSVSEEMEKTAPKTLSIVKKGKQKQLLDENQTEMEGEKTEQDEVTEILSRIKSQSFDVRCHSNPNNIEYINWKKKMLKRTS